MKIGEVSINTNDVNKLANFYKAILDINYDSDDEMHQLLIADENLIAVSKSSAFSLEERKAYFKKKWRKEHISLFVILGLIFVASVTIPWIIDKIWMIGFSGLIALIEYGYQNNQMMIYIENQLYD